MNRRIFLKRIGMVVGGIIASPLVPPLAKTLVKRVTPSAVRPFVPGFDKWIFPIIRHVPETDMIDQIIGVQPMMNPSPGLMLYLDFKYKKPSLWSKIWSRFRIRRNDDFQLPPCCRNRGGFAGTIRGHERN